MGCVQVAHAVKIFGISLRRRERFVKKPVRQCRRFRNAKEIRWPTIYSLSRRGSAPVHRLLTYLDGGSPLHHGNGHTWVTLPGDGRGGGVCGRNGVFVAVLRAAQQRVFLHIAQNTALPNRVLARGGEQRPSGAAMSLLWRKVWGWKEHVCVRVRGGSQHELGVKILTAEESQKNACAKKKNICE